MDERDTRRAPRILGLTGPIGCGKTTVGDILLELGALERIDADRVVHGLMKAGTQVTAALRALFGDEVLMPDGSINRPALGRVVFSEPEQLRRLEAITHPAVRAEIRRRLEAFAGREGVIVVDAVKLLQSDLLPLADTVWVVTCDPAVERRRLTEIRRMSEADAAARLRAQPPFDHPRVSAVIENSGTLEQLRQRVEDAWRETLSGWAQ